MRISLNRKDQAVKPANSVNCLLLANVNPTCFQLLACNLWILNTSEPFNKASLGTNQIVLRNPHTKRMIFLRANRIPQAFPKYENQELSWTNVSLINAAE